MDFSAADLVADTTFLPDALLADGLPPANAQRGARYCAPSYLCTGPQYLCCRADYVVRHLAEPACPACRFLAPLQPVDVWVELEVPRETWQGVAQLVAQLTSLDGRPAAKASRALMLQENAWSLRCLKPLCVCLPVYDYAGTPLLIPLLSRRAAPACRACSAGSQAPRQRPICPRTTCVQVTGPGTPALGGAGPWPPPRSCAAVHKLPREAGGAFHGGTHCHQGAGFSLLLVACSGLACSGCVCVGRHRTQHAGGVGWGHGLPGCSRLLCWPPTTPCNSSRASCVDWK
jgi:hypothetical protein